MKKALAIILPVALIFMILYAYALNSSTTVQNFGGIKIIGVITDKDIIEWGMLAPSSSKNEIIKISPNGTIPVKLSMNTANWNPQNASTFLVVSWNYTDAIIQPDEWVSIELTLSVDKDIIGIEAFFFEIIIIATEA